MSIFKNYREYYKNNPEGYWFKRKLYGWGCNFYLATLFYFYNLEVGIPLACKAYFHNPLAGSPYSYLLQKGREAGLGMEANAKRNDCVYHYSFPVNFLAHCVLGTQT